MKYYLIKGVYNGSTVIFNGFNNFGDASMGHDAYLFFSRYTAESVMKNIKAYFKPYIVEITIDNL